MTTHAACVDCSTVITSSIPKGKLIVSGCYHTYCIECLKRWVASVEAVEKPCPLCRQLIYKQRGGKDFHVIWNIFLRILQKRPEKVWGVLSKSEGKNDQCSSCLDDFPSLLICYDAKNRQFKHIKCSSIKLPELTVPDVIQVVKLYAAEYKVLEKKLSTKPPSIFEKIIKYFYR